MNRKVTRALLLLSCVIGMIGCSDPDIHYTLTITGIEKNKDAYYCIYLITQDNESEPEFPKTFFVDTCDKYKVGDTITRSL